MRRTPRLMEGFEGVFGDASYMRSRNKAWKMISRELVQRAKDSDRYMQEEQWMVAADSWRTLEWRLRDMVQDLEKRGSEKIRER